MSWPVLNIVLSLVVSVDIKHQVYLVTYLSVTLVLAVCWCIWVSLI